MKKTDESEGFEEKDFEEDELEENKDLMQALDDEEYD